MLAAPWVQLSVSAGNGWPHNALRHHWFMPVSCHFRDCKALLVTSMTHVSGAITSVLTFTFLPLKFHMKIFYVAAGARLLQPKWIRIALLQNPLPCTVCTPRNYGISCLHNLAVLFVYNAKEQGGPIWGHIH